MPARSRKCLEGPLGMQMLETFPGQRASAGSEGRHEPGPPGVFGQRGQGWVGAGLRESGGGGKEDEGPVRASHQF